MRLRSSDEVRKTILDNFLRDFPGEKINECVFSTYLLDCYCKTVEKYELCRQMLREL